MKKLKFIAIAMLLICIFGKAKSISLNDSQGKKDSTEIKIDTLIAQMGLSSKEFISMISGCMWKQNCFDAYELIESEMEHVVALTWGWDL